MILLFKKSAPLEFILNQYIKNKQKSKMLCIIQLLDKKTKKHYNIKLKNMPMMKKSFIRDVVCITLIFIINLYGKDNWFVLLREGFNNDTLPPGWKVIDGNNSGLTWTVGRSPDSAYAYFSGDTMICYNEELISPSISIPTNAESLRIQYFYYFQVYQIGPKYKVKVRKHIGGNWSSWSNIAVYTNSCGGFSLIYLTSYLPADSIQFNWFYSDSGASSSWSVFCVVDSIIVSYFSPSGLEENMEIEKKKLELNWIEIYDISGRLFKKILLPTYSPTLFPTGIYFVKLKCRNFQEIKKVILLK